MRILVDRHHADLTFSLQRLFEDRLGYELFVPVGHGDHGWWNDGIWRFGEVFGDDRLARQYLEVNAQWRDVEPGLWITFDACHPERPIYGCSLEWARAHTWDLVLASVQENQAGFRRFAQEVGARYLYQIGNAHQGINESLNPILLTGAQEFDYLTTFRYRQPERMNRIVSFVNLLPRIPESWEPFESLSKLLPYEFRSFGHDCPDGFLTPVAAIAEEMARAGWAYQDKPTGDGFGHVVHGWAAVGRPLIGHGRYYSGQRAECFWQDGLTCIDLDKHSVEAAARIIAAITSEGHEQMCRNIRAVLERHYDPKADAQIVKSLLKDKE